MQRQHVLDVVSSLRLQADAIETCEDSQEFDEAIAAIRSSIETALTA